MASTDLMLTTLAGYGSRGYRASPPAGENARANAEGSQQVAEAALLNPAGKSQGAQRQEAAEQPAGFTAKELTEAIKEVEVNIQVVTRDLQFRVDEDYGDTVLSVLDGETGEVVRQIPSEEVVAIARMIRERMDAAGTLINETT